MASDLIKLAILTSDDIFILLAEEYVRQKKEFKQVVFDFENYDEERCENDFRFEKHDIVRLKEAFKLPDWMKTKEGTRFKGIEGLCIMLRRLAYPNRWADLQLIFGRSSAGLSQIFNCMIHRIWSNFRHVTSSLNQWWMDKNSLRKYADAIHRKGAPVPGCFGFIDGTVLRICRPKKNQQEVFSGHKRIHCLKYQAVVLPNGLIGSLFGDIPGRRHDSYMLSESKLLENLDEVIGEDSLYLYGDKGYPLKKYLMTPYPSNLGAEQTTFNSEMSRLRIAVEWQFGEVYDQFAFLRYKHNLKLYLQPIGKYVVVATILTNAQTCLYGNQTADYFKLSPPILENYLHNTPPTL